MRRFIGGLAIAAVLVGTAACESSSQPGAAPTTPPVKPATPPVEPGAASNLQPGTPEYILANQPDFVGDMTLEAGLLKMTAKVARKGGNARLEADAGQVLANLQGKGRLLVITRPNQSTLLINLDQKKYYEAPVAPAENTADYIATYVRGWREKGWKVEQVGEESIDGRPAVKFRIAPPAGSAAAAVTNTNAANTNAAGQPAGGDEAFAWVAKDLSNLIIKLEGRIENQAFRLDVKNASTDVPDTLFAPPAGFPEGFTKVSNARELANPSAAAAPATNTAQP